jgi:uncharacterized protein (DUF2235 family)
VGAAVGEGVDEQILNAYQFVGKRIRDFDKDEVWVIGFSRGGIVKKN